MDLKDFLAWAAPIASTVIVTFLTAQINLRTKREEETREERHAENDARRKKEAEWRERVESRLDDMDVKLDALADATQTTMRTSLLHYIEKYLTRGWVTPEERASIYDMHKKYSALNANGYIDSYIERVMALPDREI